jgi:predicted small secreted protein
MKKFFLSVLLLVFFAGISGCQTNKGAGSGADSDNPSGIFGMVKKLDDWIKDNAW